MSLTLGVLEYSKNLPQWYINVHVLPTKYRGLVSQGDAGCILDSPTLITYEKCEDERDRERDRCNLEKFSSSVPPHVVNV